MDLVRIFLIACAGRAAFALITGLLAKRKGRIVALWAVAGAMVWVVALVGLAFFHNLKDITDDQQAASRKREKVFCGILIGVGSLGLVCQLLGF